jgi:hypothetical protein
MMFILQDEIPQIGNIFIDDLAIKEPKTTYPDKDGKPETLKENPAIHQFAWEHFNDVHKILHQIGESGATFSGSKAQIGRREVIITGHKCTPEGRLPSETSVDKF